MTLQQIEMVDFVAIKIGVFKNGGRGIDLKFEACAPLRSCRVVVGVESYFRSCFIYWTVIFKQGRVFNFQNHALLIYDRLLLLLMLLCLAPVGPSTGYAGKGKGFFYV